MDLWTPLRDDARQGAGPSTLSAWTAAVHKAWPARVETMRRFVRYALVSLVSTSTSLVTLGVLVGLAGTSATVANVLATAVGTVPSFELNRRWVWNSTGRRSVLGQVVPFCLLSFTGLVVSTLAVGVVASQASGWGRWDRTAAVLGANVASYGALWVVQYLLLDRVLFTSRAPSAGGSGRTLRGDGPESVSDGPAPTEEVDHDCSVTTDVLAAGGRGPGRVAVGGCVPVAGSWSGHGP